MTALGWRLASVLTALVVLSACANKPAPAPMLTIESLTCAARPDLAAAITLAFDAKSEKSVTELIDASAPCLAASPGEKSLYRLFALPTASVQYVVSVASTPIGDGVFAPHLELLDAKGTIAREIPRESFVFRNTDLSALFISHAAERYLLVASDPQRVGQTVTRLEESRNTTPVVAGPFVFNAYTGGDAMTNLVYAHSGRITVTLSGVPSAK